VADLHFLRQQREVAIEGVLSASAKVSEESELAAMRAVDSVIVHSSVEAAILQEKDATLRVHTVPWTVFSRPCAQPFADRSGYAFVGGYGHRPNVDAALYLAREIAPLLSKAHPGLTGFLIGSKVPPEVASLEAKNLKVLGFVPDLTDFLHRLRCTVAPLRYGAGLKGKILESFAHGLPCIMTSVAAEGLDLPPELEWLIAQTPKEFAEKLVAVHEDKSLNEKLGKHAVEYIERGYSVEAIQPLFAKATSRHSESSKQSA
jgi:glycosyltransferase involved in cell wall biosynthesis